MCFLIIYWKVTIEKMKAQRPDEFSAKVLDGGRVLQNIYFDSF